MYLDLSQRSQIEEVAGPVIRAADSWDVICDVRSPAEFEVRTAGPSHAITHSQEC